MDSRAEANFDGYWNLAPNLCLPTNSHEATSKACILGQPLLRIVHEHSQVADVEDETFAEASLELNFFRHSTLELYSGQAHKVWFLGVATMQNLSIVSQFVRKKQRTRLVQRTFHIPLFPFPGVRDLRMCCVVKDRLCSMNSEYNSSNIPETQSPPALQKCHFLRSGQAESSILRVDHGAKAAKTAYVYFAGFMLGLVGMCISRIRACCSWLISCDPFSPERI